MAKQSKEPGDDVLRLAVKEAGGVEVVANLLGMAPQQLYYHFREKRLHAHHVRPLSCAGGYRVSIDQILDYLEKARAAEKGQVVGGGQNGG